MCLVYKNWQRPGSAISLTVKEAEEAELKNEKLIIHIRLIYYAFVHLMLLCTLRIHKTYKTYGLAVLVLEGDDIAVFNFYLNQIRPTVNIDYLQRWKLDTVISSPNEVVSKKTGLPPLPNFTDVRKAGSTSVVERRSDVQLTLSQSS